MRLWIVPVIAPDEASLYFTSFRDQPRPGQEKGGCSDLTALGLVGDVLWPWNSLPRLKMCRLWASRGREALLVHRGRGNQGMFGPFGGTTKVSWNGVSHWNPRFLPGIGKPP